MANDLSHSQRILGRLKSTKSGLARAVSQSATVQPVTFTGLGTAHAGSVLTSILCASSSGRDATTTSCPNIGTLLCSQYCSERCQRRHLSRHRVFCEHELRSIRWRPNWVKERRSPQFAVSSRHPLNSLWNTSPIFNCLDLSSGIVSGDTKQTLRICFPAGSLNKLIATINCLPIDFRGHCDILLNDIDAVVINRHLILLYALLRSGRDVEESAEFATHLMYSAFLTPPCADYLKSCVAEIYGVGPGECDMSFHRSLETRGGGKLYTVQTTMGIKRPVEMAMSTYGFTKARRSHQEALLHISDIDNRERFLMKLKPSHRLVLMRFWETGVLAPFFLNTASFNQPNRLHFSAQGEYLGHPSDANTLQGWDITAIKNTGVSLGLDPTDILGCLFFHVKSELMKFADRLQKLSVTIYLTQFDVRVLSKGICAGLLPAFETGCFDRIDAGDLMDTLGVRDCLASLGPLVNLRSPGACILMQSRTWYHHVPGAIARANPRLFKILMAKAKLLPRLRDRLRKANVSETGQEITSTSLLRLIDYLDAFVDHCQPFNSFLERQGIAEMCKRLGFKHRDQNRHHPSRIGLRPRVDDNIEGRRSEEVPGLCLTKEEFYDLFVLGNAEFPTRFIEFEPLPLMLDDAASMRGRR
ncbi:hypothetical protein AGABI2DRAFT_151745 [Agaricus bisporus var. bisporus H97]|uniref:hypothetical protein n=1 Tax=Agaricus bisporus var. bisporus (strain H97 / ATCC MYA-4626 / FGSC 10389) TaxID=936046 RepID=UPI00029F795A|nr:hypothetical protein AGABI2DRAFT_151745 [Agaricus bisporus var. bisporus H97]EKV46859.1 hypothetical protein AGABI2DRAFT_151745 [Agaricus bisporus var. bisporus H97]